MHLTLLQRRHNDPLVTSCTESVKALADVWTSIVVLNSTDARVITVQREIARWAHDTNRLLTEKFGHGVVSDEIRVILVSIADTVAKLPRDGRLFLELTASEAADLARRAETALESALGAPLPVSVPPYGG